MEIHNDIITAFHPDAIDVFVYSLLKLMPPDEIESKFSEPVCAVPLKVAVNVLRDVLGKLDQDKHHVKGIKHFIGSLKLHLIPMPRVRRVQKNESKISF